MFRSIKSLSASVVLASVSMLCSVGAVANAQPGGAIFQGPSETVDMAKYIDGVWYTEAEGYSQFHYFGNDGAWEMASYETPESEPFYANGRYELEQLDPRLHRLTIIAEVPDGPLSIPDTIMAGEDRQSMVSVETGGVFMRVEN